MAPRPLIAFLAIPLSLLCFRVVAGDREKNAVPDAEARGAALKVVREVYESDFASADSADDRAALTARMIATALKTEELAPRYVLLRVARDIAIRDGNIEGAMTATKEIAASFQVDRFELQLETLSKVATESKTRSKRQASLSELTVFFHDAMAAERYKAANVAASVAESLSHKQGDFQSRQTWAGRGSDADLLANQLTRVNSAIETLHVDPDDPDAILAVGTYRCFVRGDWLGGVPLLAKSSDDELKKIAAQELVPPDDSDDFIAIGDGWWNHSETDEAIAGDCKRRAAFWYAKAFPDQTGLSKVRLQQRMDDVASIPIASWRVAAALERDNQPLRPDTPIAAEPAGGPSPLPEPVIHYTFDEGKGRIAHDSAGEDQFAALKNMGDDSWVKGIVGSGAINIDQKNQSVEAGSVPELKLGAGSFTVAAWVKVAEAGFFLQKGHPGSIRSRGFALATGTFQLGTRNRSSNAGFPFDSSLVVDGRWHHVAAVRDIDKREVCIFVDGKLIRRATYGDFDLTHNGEPVLIGNSMRGDIDDVRIYRHALDTAGIQSLVGMAGDR